MARKQAKTLTNEQLVEVLEHIQSTSRHQKRDRCWVLLSFRAGLRAQEIAYLWADDVTDAAGTLRDVVFVSARGAKYGKKRSVPMTQDLQRALRDYMVEFGISSGPLFFDQFGRAMDTKTGANAVQQHLRRLYVGSGFAGCSSHSGRRTFITTLARRCNEVHGSLRDVQNLAGHADLTSTEQYIELVPSAHSLVGLLMQPKTRTEISQLAGV